VTADIYTQTFPNGLTLLAERLPHVRSASFNFAIPAGCAYDPPARLGVANLLSELVMRGAGEHSSEELATSLDSLGLDRSETVSLYNTRFRGATIATNLIPALELYADVLLRPHLDAEELEPVRALALQDLRGLEDDPPSKVMLELYKRTYPPPLGNDHRGTEETLAAITIDDIHAHHKRTYGPQGAILAVAGDFQWDPLRAAVGHLFGDWQGGHDRAIAVGQLPEKRAHITKEVAETQIALACDSVPLKHPDYYLALGAVNVLSGGMSSRLFTEIREKEGLCYSVSASYQMLPETARVLAYAGSVNDKAQRTLDLLLRELHHLRDGITQDEVDRVIVSLKTSQIMQQESTSSRATALSTDWFYLGRVRSFDEIRAGIESLTPEKIVGYCQRHPLCDFAIVTLGPRPLTIPADA
jgi:predicted Zn-dependent peptidase